LCVKYVVAKENNDMDTLLEVKRKLKTQDIFRAKTVRALVDQIEALQRSQAAETDEFNAGYEAAQRGESIESEPSHTSYDVWRIGWVWGDYQRRATIERVIIATAAYNQQAIQTVINAEKAKAAK
jgi:hypothetical protein